MKVAVLGDAWSWLTDEPYWVRYRGYRWLDDRLGIREIFEDVGSKYVPPHVNIFYCFGGLVFTS